MHSQVHVINNNAAIACTVLPGAGRRGAHMSAWAWPGPQSKESGEAEVEMRAAKVDCERATHLKEDKVGKALLRRLQ